MCNETINTLDSLRTIHWNFKEEQVSDKDIETIIKVSMRAANATNLANYSVIVVEEPSTIEKLVGKPAKAKCLVYCIDFNRIIETGKVLGYDYRPNTNWYCFLAYMFDIYALAQTAVIAAKSMGIDSLITNGIFRQDINEVKKLLKLPEKYCFPAIAVLFGYSDKPQEETVGRLDPKYITHYGYYNPVQEIDHKEIISQFDKIYPEYISEKYKHTLDWYHNEWLGSYSGNPSELDKKLYQALRESGFDL